MLLSCLRQELTAPQRAELEAAACSSAVVWPAVFATAVRHQVAPLVFHHLASSDRVVARIPPEVAARFHHETMRNIAAKARMAEALCHALGWFSELGVDVMLVKGTALDHRLWRETWFTVSGDVDLLLRARREDLPADALSRIHALGRGTPTIDVDFPPHPDLSMNGIVRIDFDRAWSAATEVSVAGQRAYLMDPVDELIAACVNSCRKRFLRLKSLCEIAGLVRDTPIGATPIGATAIGATAIDWDEVCRRARDYDCDRIVYTALRSADLAVGLDLPWQGDRLRRALGVSRLRARLLDELIVRKSFCTLASLFRGVDIAGRHVGPSLLLHYAGQRLSQVVRSAVLVARRRA